MRAGSASETARRVAAHRLTFDRVPAPFGNAAADERLARNVAGTAAIRSSGPMVSYLAARTAFFDRVVVRAVEAGIAQVVIVAAGYDGRALRYAKPGVRWFEVDHPDTQRDKRERLERLDLDTSHITFVPADFATDDVGHALTDAGLGQNQPSLLLCEGVAIYLERTVLDSLLAGLRQVAGASSRLAISLSVSSNPAAQSLRRVAFRSAVAAMGEPARTVLTNEEVDRLLANTGWGVTTPPAGVQERTLRARRAGLLVLEPK